MQFKKKRLFYCHNRAEEHQNILKGLWRSQPECCQQRVEQGCPHCFSLRATFKMTRSKRSTYIKDKHLFIYTYISADTDS